MKRILALTLVLVLGFAVAGCGTSKTTDSSTAVETKTGPVVRVGSLLDSEGTILGAMIIQMLEANGIATEDKTKLGTPDVVRSPACRRDRRNRRLTAPDSTTTRARRALQVEERRVLRCHQAARQGSHDIEWLAPATATNTELIATTRASPEKNSIVTMEDSQSS